MVSQETFHITPVEGGAWAVKIGESAPASSLHATEGQAVASAYEMAANRVETDVIVHDRDGSIRSMMKIRRDRPMFDSLDARIVLGDLDDLAARAEALRITPSNARLKSGLVHRLPVKGADLESDPSDLY